MTLPQPAEAPVRLVRAIRRWDLVALVLNFIVGAGIFGLPSRVHALAGDFSLLAYIACAIPIFLIILCFAEVSSRFNETGGPYLFGRVFGPLAGFEIGWLTWVARLTGFAALCNLFVDYLAMFLPVSTPGFARTTAVVTVVAGITAVNLRGVRQASIFNNIFTLGKLVPLIVLVVVGTAFVDPAAYSAAGTPDYSGFSAAVLLLVFAFTGFENAVIPAGEASNPRRDLPFALLTGTAIATLLYIAIQAVSIGAVPNLASSERPLADVGARLFGNVGAAFIAVGALVSILGTLNGVLLAGSRLLFAMGEQGQLPPRFARTHPRLRTPQFAIIVTAMSAVLLTLTGTFLSLARLSTVVRLTTYAVTCLAVPVLRRRADRPAQFLVPGGNVVAAVALVLIGWLFSSSNVSDALVVLAAAGIALVFYVTLQGRWHPAVPRTEPPPVRPSPMSSATTRSLSP
jgi:amino acid transporter